MEVLSAGRMAVRCRGCSCLFAFEPKDCFLRYVPVRWNGGSFDRKECIFVRCPTCAKRVNVTGRVSPSGVTGDDPLCRCAGPYCRCD